MLKIQRNLINRQSGCFGLTAFAFQWRNQKGHAARHSGRARGTLPLQPACPSSSAAVTAAPLGAAQPAERQAPATPAGGKRGSVLHPAAGAFRAYVPALRFCKRAPRAGFTQ